MSPLARSLAAIAVVLGSALPVLPATSGWSQLQKITSTPRGVGAQFATAVAIGGDTMVVGARFDSAVATQAGAAFVYVLNGTTWTQQAKLVAPDGALSDKFGNAVAISGDTIVVGAFNDDTPVSNAGSAYVFVRTGTAWSFQQQLKASDATADDEFGNAVGIDGDDIVVGAHLADLPNNAGAGSAYVFRRSGATWAMTQKLVPVAGPFPAPTVPVGAAVAYSPILGDSFGESIAMSGGRVAVGSSRADLPETAAGAVYVYAGSSGTYGLQQKLIIPNGTNGDLFGCSVSLEGNTLVGGAREDTQVIGKPAFGAAYVFEFSGGTWALQGKLIASDGAPFDRFGWSVAVSNSVVIVGAREDDTTVGPDAGSAYVFTRSGTTWTQQEKLSPMDTFNSDRFGSSIAFNANNLVIGAAEKALTGPNGQGAAYVFSVSAAKVKPTRFDYDGDGSADISSFRSSNGQWWVQQSTTSNAVAATFGQSGDRAVPADYDGDGKTDYAVFRPPTGEWFVLRSSNTTLLSMPFGVATDIPNPGDFDGDGKADVATFRPSGGTWYINKTSGGVQITQWGMAGDVPVAADYDGDGKADLAVFRPSDGSWRISRSTAGPVTTTFGVGTDKPVPADFTGDGKADIAVWRPGNGSWYILRSEDSSFYAAPFGTNGDVPVPADYDRDGKADLAVFRPNGANWYIQRSTQGILIQQFGANGDVATPAAFVP